MQKCLPDWLAVEGKRFFPVLVELGQERFVIRDFCFDLLDAKAVAEDFF